MISENRPHPEEGFLFVCKAGKLWDYQDCREFICIAPAYGADDFGLCLGNDRLFDRRDFDGSVNGFI